MSLYARYPHNPVYTGLVCNMLQEVLQDKNAPLFTIINKEFAQKLVDSKGAAYTNPWYGQLMTGPQLIAYLVQLNMWLESYKIQLV